MEAKAFSFTHRTKVFADGTGTSGGLTESPGGTGVSRPISTDHDEEKFSNITIHADGTIANVYFSGVSPCPCYTAIP
jgi:hypothetical protein